VLYFICYSIYNMNNTLNQISTLSDENNPKILSNKLDQAPKFWKAYEERLKDPELQQQIIDAMDNYFVFIEKEWDGGEIIERLRNHQNDIYLPLIYESKNRKVSFLIHKEKKEPSKDSAFTPMIGMPLDANYQMSKLWECLYKNYDELNIWDIWTFITFTKDDSGRTIVWAEQIEIPYPAFLGDWYACHKELKSEEFKKIMDKSTYLQNNK
jgi:hypothetical protein